MALVVGKQNFSVGYFGEDSDSLNEVLSIILSQCQIVQQKYQMECPGLGPGT